MNNTLKSYKLKYYQKIGKIMILLSPDFKDGDFLDEKFSLSKDYGFGCSGKNIRPHLKWDNISEKVVELAITIFDPDAPTGCGFWHWIMVGVSRKYFETNDDCLSNSIQVQNDFGSYSYGGPCPPENDHPHRYYFTIYGLNSKIDAHKDTPAAQIGFQLHFKAIERASLLGLFKR